jgi:hypothetical protein
MRTNKNSDRLREILFSTRNQIVALQDIKIEMLAVNKAIADATPGAIQSTVKTALANAEVQASIALLTGKDPAKAFLPGIRVCVFF